MRKRMSRSGSSHLYQREATVRLQRIRELCKGVRLEILKAHTNDFAGFSPLKPLCERFEHFQLGAPVVSTWGH